MRILLVFFLLVAITEVAAPAAAENLTASKVSKMSFDDLLSQTIYSASKEDEELFEAPLSATVLTREEIERAGSASIPEALRLVPGVIVREQTNGVYNVHLRGFDYLPIGSILNSSSNNLTLVMIDGRVVYNYLSGGTFWESLPVDIHDLDRIEVIRGPVSSLYGPNAVTGVIHLITRSPVQDGSRSDAHIEGGSHSTAIMRASTQHRWENGNSFRLSANGQSRERKTVEYYNYSKGEYTSNPSELAFLTSPRPLNNPDSRYPNEERSLGKAGINLFLEGTVAEVFDVDVDVGYQEDQTKRAFDDVEATPLTTTDSTSQYVNVRAKSDVSNFQFAVTDGGRDIAGSPELSFDSTTYDTSLDYHTLISDVSVRPGVAYRRAEASNGARFEEGDPTLDLYSSSLRLEKTLGDFTLIGAVRADKYDIRSKIFPSYQGVIGYQPSDRHSFRASYGRAFRSPFLQDAFEVVTFNVNESLNLQGRGNPELDLLTNDTAEIGWRARISDELESDIELFWARNKNYHDIFADGSSVTEGGVTTVILPFQQLDLRSEQFGSTTSLQYSIGDFTTRLFGTVQKTHLQYARIDPADPATEFNGDNDNTPDYFGGFYLNWAPNVRWNFNLNSYYIGSSKQLHRSSQIVHEGPRSVSSKWIFSAKISYQVADGASVFVNARNLLNNDSREFANTDRIDALYLTGIELSL